MNKHGHILVTSHVIPEEVKHYRFCILAGSIMPDFLFHTYIVGHTWKAVYKRTLKRLQSLEGWGSVNVFSFFWLGYLLHYVEDFFTFPHNEEFKGNIAEHVSYESKMLKNMKQFYQEEKAARNDMSFMTVEALCCYLIDLHKEYLEKERTFETDRYYIERAASGVLTCFSAIFARNESFIKAIRLKALQTISQIDIPGSHVI